MTNKEAIARLEDIDRFDAYHLDSNEFTEDDHNSIKEVINWLKTLEERPTGEWEKAINLCTDKVVFRCSACGRLVENCSRANLAEFYPYCNCGADMRGGAE